ncbi:MAG: hypothetical protein CMC86_03380 [Flavobacteriaceae bacterium]|nr:hypothetical protein [Flavobacteriaceae bacterium]
MKKLLLLSALLIFACSDDEGNNNQTSELIGTYSFIVGYDDIEDEENSFYTYECPTDYFEFTDSLFLIGFTDTDDCSDTSYLEEYSATYELLSNTSQQIEGIINNVSGNESDDNYFIFNKSTQILNRYFTLDGTYPSANNWEILEVWQKD